MLIDEVEIKLKAGHGGAGKVAFFPGMKSGPSGGNGGRGGDIYLVSTSDLTVLDRLAGKKLLSAENGDGGGSNRKFGKDGEDLIVTVPVGSELTEKNTGEKVVLNTVDQKILICKGGLGGRGNFEFKSPRNTTPEYAQPGLPGQEKDFQIVLKLIADYGLIGLPNAGKSSLLNELTKANAKIGSYAFTTLEPNLGVLNRKILADIPGLIEGASAGKGLGIKFLKHIEKVGVLLHCISAESEDVVNDYNVVINELREFSPELAEKEQTILLTKTDLVDASVVKQKIQELKKFKKKIIPISIHDWESVQSLIKEL